MIGHMGYAGKFGGGYGMGGMYFFSFLFLVLLVALIWLVISKALLNSRKFKVMKDFPMHSGKHMMMMHKHGKECTCGEGEDHEVSKK